MNSYLSVAKNKLTYTEQVKFVQNINSQKDSLNKISSENIKKMTPKVQPKVNNNKIYLFNKNFEFKYN